MPGVARPSRFVALGLFAGAVALLTTSAARSSPSFPATLVSTLGLRAVPRCTLCHGSAGVDAPTAGDAFVGDSGDVEALTPFARSLTARGLRPRDDASLRIALEAMQRDRVDTDGDGALDLDELWWGGDPSTPDVPQGSTIPAPSYGCLAIARVGWSTRRSAIVLPLGVVAALVLVGLLRRRRAKRE